MPCYVQYIVGEFQDLEALEKAAKQLGLAIRNTGRDTFTIGNMTVSKVGDTYKVRTSATNQRTLNDLKDEYGVAMTLKRARKEGWKLGKRTKNKNTGEITVKLWMD